jgi:hypothetical protein
MRWPDLLESALELLRERSLMPGSALAGVTLRRTGEIRKAVPHSIGYTAIDTDAGDGWEGILLQLDIWGPGYPAVVAMEREVRRALDRPVDFMGPLGFMMTSEYDDGRDGADAEEGAANRSIDFNLRAARN